MDSGTGTQTSVDLLKWLAWLDKNKKRVALWGGGGLAVILLVVGIVAYENSKEVRASEALSEVANPMRQGRLPGANAAEDLLKIEREHPGTKAAARALLEAGQVRYLEGNYAEAQKLFSRFEKDYPESRWVPQALLGYAATLEVQQKTTEAIAEYEKLRKRYATDSIADSVKLALARLYEPTKPEESFNLYQELLRANPPQMSTLGAEASTRQEALLQRIPSLIKTNVPPLPTIPGVTNLQVRTITNPPAAAPVTNVLKLTNAPVPAAITNVLKLTNAPAAKK